MALHRSANRDNQNMRGNEFQDSIEMNAYESVEDWDTNPHIYLSTGTAAATTGAGTGNLNGSTTAATSKRSCRPVCLALFGGIVLGTVISTITGVIVYYQVIDANRQIPQDPHTTPGTNVLDGLNQRLDAIQERQNSSQMDLDQRMETLVNTVQAFQKRQNSSQMDLDQRMETLVNTVQAFQKRQKSSQTDVNRQLDGLDNKVQALKIHMLRDMNQSQTTLDNKIKTLQDRQHVLSQQVAFAVDNATGHDDNVLTFSNVIMNVGDSYDQVTGIFRCPVAGTYLFSATLVGGKSRTTHTKCWIRMNRSRVVEIYSQEGVFDYASRTVILQLAVGDLVDMGSCENVDNSSKYSMFTGSLIQAD